MTKRRIDPKGFVDLLNHLKESAQGVALPEFLASHPDVVKRINYIQEASNGATVKEDEKLKAIFEKLKL
ncbi:MAG: hypothetical protein IPP43_05490 [Chitinophagaceae bacterium]|nr:hypothetical protein [Chitinophagaceae bacterium]